MKKILFLTGTRADFGKISPLIETLNDVPDFEHHLFVTGMHLLEKFGYTFIEVQRNSKSITLFKNQSEYRSLSQDLILAETISGLNECVFCYKPDMIVVHGDRVEALAGAIVGALNNILVAHIEGGELSGTIDEVIRHSISKLAHIHFVANTNARSRLLQLGESQSAIFIIGSPDIDLMLSDRLPSLEQVKRHYEIEFDSYAIFCYHPVTTESQQLRQHIGEVVKAVKMSGDNFIVIEPNNDPGREVISEAIHDWRKLPGVKTFPSINHLSYLTLLKNCQYLIGNSSSGVREAPIYAKPSINVGTRQNHRHQYKTIINTPEDCESIVRAIERARSLQQHRPSFHFGNGGSAKKFLACLRQPALWQINVQKTFRDLEPAADGNPIGKGPRDLPRALWKAARRTHLPIGAKAVAEQDERPSTRDDCRKTRRDRSPVESIR